MEAMHRRRPGVRIGSGSAHALRVGAAVVVILVGCRPIETAHDRHRPSSPREAYLLALDAAGLGATALARDWRAVGDEALGDPLAITLPFRETGYLTPERPVALAYRFTVRQGRRITLSLDRTSSDTDLVFLDLFGVTGESASGVRPVASADSGATYLEYMPPRDAELVLRVQPELLRGGRYTLTISGAPTLTFPVHGGRLGDIRSVFGDPRDDGERSHHGVDIFASRGTPVVAASEGTITRVRTTPLGGKVIWLRDHRDRQSLYYAHLDSQFVTVGQWVQPGDTLGLVGNTGNAVTTPPHLHFAIYRRGEGPVDPWPFIASPASRLPPLEVDTAVLGQWTRSAREGLRLRARPTLDSPPLEELPLHTAMRGVAASGRWYRVRLPDGTGGYVASWLTEPIGGPVHERRTGTAAPLRAGPRADAPVVATLGAGEPLPVLGRFGPFLMVQAAAGAIGWTRGD